MADRDAGALMDFLDRRLLVSVKPMSVVEKKIPRGPGKGKIMMTYTKKKRVLCSALVLLGILAVSGAASAHHSVTAEFNPGAKATWTGVISHIDWINPHSYVYLDVKDESGKVTTWSLETLPPGMLHRAGLTRDLLEGSGQVVTVLGYPAKDGTKNLGWIVTITYADGHVYKLGRDLDSEK